MKKISMAVGAAIALAGVTAPAQAQTSWSFASFGSDGVGAPPSGACRMNNSSVGNVATCDATGASTEVITVRGYSFSGTSSTSTTAKGTLENFDPSGIGMCNTNEISQCSGAPNHALDNSGTFTDFILLQTGSSLALKSVSIGWAGDDSDFSVLRYIGAGDPLTGLNGGVSISTMLSVSGGWALVNSVNGGSDAGTYNAFNAGDLTSKYWIVATRNSALHNVNDGGDDAFKISGVSGNIVAPNIQTVPEPSTYALMGAGLLGIFGFARRRNRNA